MLDVYDILEDVFVTIFYSVCIALATLNMFLYGFINTGTWSLQIVLVFFGDGLEFILDQMSVI